MTSYAVRDQLKDHLITPKNCALLIVDYQPPQLLSITSMDRELVLGNTCRIAKMAKAYGFPVVLSTVNVKTGINPPTVPPLKKLLPDEMELDRTQINAWEDREFHEAVEKTGRKKLIICALWTEACLTYPALDAMQEGYEVYPVTDAVGGTSLEAHQRALERLAFSGARNITWVQLLCELQRDWNRSSTVKAFKDIYFESPSSPL